MSDDELAAKVGRLERRVRALEQAVGRISSRPALDPIDLLPAIATATHGAVWALPDLAALALLPGNENLASAIASHTGRPGGLRALGRALSHLRGHVVDGLELRQIGVSRDGIVWQCGFESETRAADCASANAARRIAVSASCAPRTT